MSVRTKRSRWASLSLRLALAAVFPISGVAAQEPAPPGETNADEAVEKQVNALASKEEMIRDRFRRFEDRVFRLSEELADREPENAARLARALSRAGELGLSDKLDEIITLINDPSSLHAAIDQQAAWLSDADRLLSILLERDSDNEDRRDEIERLRQYRQRVNELLEQQESVRNASAQAQAAKRMGQQIDQALQRLKAMSEQQAKLSERSDAEATDPSKAGVQAKEQRHLSREAKELAEDISRIAKTTPPESADSQQMKEAREQAAAAAESTKSGGQSMSQAAESMEQSDQQSRAEQQKEAEEALEEAREKLEKAKAALEQQPSAEELSKEQQSVKEETQALSEQMKKDGESQGQEGKSGGKSGQPSQGSPSAQKKLDQAQQSMGDAAESLEQDAAGEAVPKQDEAIEKLEEAKKELEEALEQLRKEEREEALRDLESRFRELLAKQRPINEATLTLDEVGRDNFKRAERLRLADLSTDERELAKQAATCLHILDEEGTTIAFPRIVGQLGEDMETVAERLAVWKVGRVTQTIEQEIVETLEQLLAAVKKMQQESEQQDGQGSKSDGNPPLLPKSAELRLLRASQNRVNTRTLATQRSVAEGDETAEGGMRVLRKLATRQLECQEIAKDMRDRDQ
ncbi:MAG: hypothetical protein IID35_01045 [Planctomycetes bacterium]|nr:hypothetical protein [Planctomycetota bacterium]